MSKNRTRQSRLAALLAAGVLLVASCGDDVDSATSPSGDSSAATTSSSVPDEPLDAPGAVDLPLVGLEPSSPLDAGTYRTPVLGTEIALTTTEPLALGMAQAGVLGFDDGEDNVVFISRIDPSSLDRDDVEPTPLGADGTFDVEAYLDDLAAAGVLSMTAVDEFTVDERSVAVHDVTPTELIELGGELAPEQTSRLWIVDQGDFTPIMGQTNGDEAWLERVDELVRSMRFGAPVAAPGVGVDEPWLVGLPGEDVGTGTITLPVLGEIEIDLPRSVMIFPGSGTVVEMFWSGTGVVAPNVRLAEPGTLLGSGTVLPFDVVRDGEVASVDDLLPALEQADSLTEVPDAPDVLGAPSTAFDFSTTADVPLFLADASQWARESGVSLRPNTEGRIWLVDTDRGPLVVIAEAETETPDDLAAAIAVGEAVSASIAEA